MHLANPSGLNWGQRHAVMAREGILPTVTDMFCQAGNAQLDAMPLGGAYTVRVESLRDLIEAYDREVAMLERHIRQRVRGHAGYKAIQAINGIGPTMAAILVAEIGDVSRFRSAAALCSWGGSPPSTTSPTPRYGGGRSPSRGRGWCGGRSSRAPSATTAAPPWPATTGASRSAAARTKQGGGRPQGPHARLLRPARRADPLCRPGRPGGGVNQLGHGRARARYRHDPRPRRGRRTA